MLFAAQLSVDLSLSRLNHCLPRGQAHPEVVQGTTEFHDQIADACFPQADAVFDDATALDTAVDMLNPQPTLVEGTGSVSCNSAFILHLCRFLNQEDLMEREAMVQNPSSHCRDLTGRKVHADEIMHHPVHL